MPNRYIGQGMQGPPPRENGNVNNNRPNRNNNWNRENHGYNSGNHGNERPNHWGPERRPNNRPNREQDDRRGPRINYLNINRRPRHYAGSRPWYDRDRRGPYRTRWSDRCEWEQNQRPTSPYRCPTNEVNRIDDNGRRRQFPPGIDRKRPNNLINRQNANH